MSNSKPAFHQINIRRQGLQRPAESPEQEVLRFIQDSWKNVCKEIEVAKIGLDGKAPTVTYYKDGLSDDQLPCRGFKPFDLDSFLEQRAVYLHNNRQVSQ